MIENVEELAANLYLDPFADPNIFEQRHIEIDKVRPAECIASKIAKRIQSGNLETGRGTGSDAIRQMTLAAVRIYAANDIGPLSGQAVVGLIV